MKRRYAWVPSAVVLCLFIGCQGVPHASPAAKAPAAAYRDPEELSRLISEKPEPYHLVDVRTAQEYSAGHIPTAVNIPLGIVSQHPPTPDRAALIIVYCASGRRSAQAAAALEKLGYVRVSDFGGITRWNGPLSTGDDAQP